MTDAERTALAERRGARMYGPLERQRCDVHRRRWVVYRWTWSVDGDVTGDDARVVRGCAECAEDYLEDPEA